jgi:CDP-glycerol glycerophosphotransferase (TagB/SpsB family)
MCSFYPRRHALRAYIHHGPGFGSGGGTHAAELCDIYFGLSGAERFYLEAKLPKLFRDNKAYFSVGFPKSDAILNGEYKRKDVLLKYGLQDRKTILIASGWNLYGLLRTLQEGPFRMLASSFPEWNVIQTGHPWLWGSREDIDPKWQSTIIDASRAVEKDYPNAYFIPSVPAEPLAVASDLLVADGSSIVTTYSLLDRPIVYFDNPERADESKRQWAAYRDAGYTFTSLGELTKTCQIAMEDASPVHREARCMLKEKFFTNPGNASDVMANILIRLGRTCTKDSPGWAHIINLSREYAAGQSAVKDA